METMETMEKVCFSDPTMETMENKIQLLTSENKLNFLYSLRFKSSNRKTGNSQTKIGKPT